MTATRSLPTRLPTWILSAALASVAVSGAAFSQVSRIDLAGLAGPQVPINPLALSFDGTTVVGYTIPTSVSVQRAFRWRLGTGMELIPSNLPGRFLDCSDDGEECIGTFFDPLFPFELKSMRWNLGTGFQRIPGLDTDAIAISGDGRYVVGSMHGPGGQRLAFRLTLTGVFDFLGPVSLPSSIGTVVSRDGSVVGGPVGTPGASTSGFFQWKVGGGVEEIFPPGGRVRVTGMSADGRVMVGSSAGPANFSQPFVWEEGGGLIDLGPLPANGIDGAAYGVSADGEVVVGSYFDVSINAREPFIWSRTLGQITKLDDHLATLGFSFTSPDQSAQIIDFSGDGRAILGRDLIAGAPDTYAAWVLYLSPPDAVVRSESVCGPASVNGSGGPAEIQAIGSGIIGLNDTHLRAEGLPAGQFTLFIGSKELGSTPLGNGTLCLGGAIDRFQSLVGASNASGEVSIPLDLHALPTPMGARPAMTGEQWYFQAWFRDPMGPSFVNLSDAARIVFH